MAGQAQGSCSQSRGINFSPNSAIPVDSLSFVSLLCNMSQDNKCRSLNCFSDTKLIQLMFLQMLNAQSACCFGSLMASKSMKCGDAEAKAAFPREGFLAGQLGTEGEGPEYQGKSPEQGAGDWKSHFNSSLCMTLNQRFFWLSLFPIWTMMWLDQLISKTLPVLTPYIH